jgi:hypothetical protein
MSIKKVIKILIRLIILIPYCFGYIICYCLSEDEQGSLKNPIKFLIQGI